MVASAFVLFTIIATRSSSTHVLKSSAIAALLAPDTDVQQALGTLENLNEAEEKAKLAKARFDSRNLILMSDSLGRIPSEQTPLALNADTTSQT